MKKLIRGMVNRLGLEFTRLPLVDGNRTFELYHYRKPDGTFDYEKYKQVQVAGNRRKIDSVWVLEENIAFLADYITKNVNRVEFGLCHGTRRGKEQEWFRKYLQCDVLGTEISDTAEQYPDTIQWDFHDVKPEWIDAVDFIYSNSFDHSYDPQKCLSAWMSCIRTGGVCIIEHSSRHERANELDPFGADIALMPYLVLTWAKGNYCVQEVLDAPSTRNLNYVKYLIIQKLGSC